MSNVNTLMHLKDDGTSRYNELGLELDQKVQDAVEAILNDAIKEHGPIDIRMFTYLAQSAVEQINLMKQF